MMKHIYYNGNLYSINIFLQSCFALFKTSALVSLSVHDDSHLCCTDGVHRFLV